MCSCIKQFVRFRAEDSYPFLCHAQWRGIVTKCEFALRIHLFRRGMALKVVRRIGAGACLVEKMLHTFFFGT